MFLSPAEAARPQQADVAGREHARRDFPAAAVSRQPSTPLHLPHEPRCRPAPQEVRGGRRLHRHTAVTLNRSQSASTCDDVNFSACSFRSPLRSKIA